MNETNNGPTGAQNFNQSAGNFSSSLKAVPPVPAPPVIAVPAPPSQPSPAHGRRILKISLITLLVLIVLAVGGYFAYAYVYNSPSAVWNKFVLGGIFSKTNQAQQINTVVTYSDKLMNEDFNFTFTNKTDYDRIAADKANSLSMLGLKYKLQGVSASIENIEVRQIDKVVYVNINSIPGSFLDELRAEYGGWVKIDIGKLQSEATTNKNYDKIKSELLSIINKHKILADHKFLNRETLDNQQTYVYDVVVDKQEIIGVINDLIDSEIDQQLLQAANTSFRKVAALPTGSKVLGTTTALSTPETDKQKSEAKALVKQFFDLLEIKNNKIWINSKDHTLHRFDFSVQTPSALNAAYPSVSGQSDDAKRLADIRQIQTGLEIYYNDYGVNPSSLAMLEPGYIYKLPTPPGKASDCGGKNVYDYREDNPVIKDGNQVFTSYSLKFCLTDYTGGFAGGLLEARPSGIQNIEMHPEWVINNTTDLSAYPKANFNLQMNFSNTAAKVDIKAPEKSLDLMEAVGGIFGGDTGF